MLLKLLHAELLDQTATRAQLGAAARLPLEVSNRWVEALVQSGLCICAADADDWYVKLTPDGGAVLRDYFVQLPHAIGHRL